MLGACLGPNQMSGPCLDPSGSNGFQGQVTGGSDAIPGDVTCNATDEYVSVCSESFDNVGTSSVGNSSCTVPCGISG